MAIRTEEIAVLQKFYPGFWISDPIGNNAFSFSQRKQRQIFVPPLVTGGVENLQVGEKCVFSEIDDNGQEHNQVGLKNFVYLTRKDKEIFIFDNHQHAFFFWCWAIKYARLPTGLTLVHIDQHKDSRVPDNFFQVHSGREINLTDAFDYAQQELNVGNFIEPALRAGFFSAVDTWTSAQDFFKSLPTSFALDLDLDIFAPELEYIPMDLKMRRIKEALCQASLVTIATSPYFMNQARAIELVQQLLTEI